MCYLGNRKYSAHLFAAAAASPGHRKIEYMFHWKDNKLVILCLEISTIHHFPIIKTASIPEQCAIMVAASVHTIPSIA